jgi:hypothetical protein
VGFFLHLKLNTIGAESLDVCVVQERDAPEVDHPQVGSGLLQDLDVEHLVHLAFLLFGLGSIFIINFCQN